MEGLVDDEFKCFDNTSALIYSSLSSSVPPAGLQLQCESSLKKLIKREVTSPAREYVEEHEEESPSAGLQLQCESSLKKLIKREVTSPAREYVEEHEEESPSGLPNEQCEVDDKVRFIKTEAASPERDLSDQNPGLHLECEPSLMKSMKEEVSSPHHVEESPPAGLQLECEPSLKKLIKREVTSPAREYVEEHEEESPSGFPNESYEEDSKELFVKTEATSPSDVDLNLGPADKQRTGSEQCLQCPYCPLTTQLESDLEIHVNSKHKNRKMLQREYITRRKSDIKLLTDSNNKKVNAFQCPHCECNTNCYFDLKAHLLFVHRKKKKLKRRCPFCDFSMCRLEGHIDAIHKKIKPFQCAHCSYKSSLKSSLKLHIDLRHNNIRPFHCPHCTSKFPSKRRLKLHIDSVHKKLKAFECPHCNYKSNYKAGLESHIDSIHSKKRRFVCPFCGYKVLRLRTLKIHIHQLHKD